jgi:hypothetical protein
MRPTVQTGVTFEHIGAARLYNGSVRIDIKTMLAVIPASEIRKLEEHWPAPVFDISDVMKNPDADPVGKAWISRSGKAVMYSINDAVFVSPLAQIKGMLRGERKYANVSTMREIQQFGSTTSPAGWQHDLGIRRNALEGTRRTRTDGDRDRRYGTPGFQLTGRCARLRLRYDSLVKSWEIRVDREGLENLVAERQRQDTIAWVFDPLPGSVAASVRGRSDDRRGGSSIHPLPFYRNIPVHP